MVLEDYIKIFEFEDDLYSECLKLKHNLIPSLTGNGLTTHRTCSEFYLHPGNEEHTDQELYKRIEKIVFDAVEKYKKDIPDAGKSIHGSHSGFHILRYQQSQEFDTHIDDFANAFRRISITLNLNDCYEGGDFVINNKTFKLKRNQILIFPSNFVFPHKVTPVSSGERWSIVTWII